MPLADPVFLYVFCLYGTLSFLLKPAVPALLPGHLARFFTLFFELVLILAFDALGCTLRFLILYQNSLFFIFCVFFCSLQNLYICDNFTFVDAIFVEDLYFFQVFAIFKGVQHQILALAYKIIRYHIFAKGSQNEFIWWF